MSTRQTINLIMSDYIDTELALNMFYSSPAFEAEVADAGTATTTNTVTKAQNQQRSIGETLKTTIDKIIKTLKGIIEKFVLKMSNAFKRLLQSDNGFMRNCRDAVVNNKPLEGVKLIVYDFNENALDTEAQKIMTAIANRVKKVTEDFIKESKTSEYDEENDITLSILKDIGAPSDVTNLEMYFSHLKEIYHQEKKEMLFTASRSNEYYRFATSSTNVKQMMEAYKSKMTQTNNMVSSRLKNIVNNPEISDEVKKRMIKRTHVITQLLNIQTHFLDMYMHLKLEKIFMYRTVMKKLYHFS